MTAVKALDEIFSESGWLSPHILKLLSEIKLAVFADPSQVPLEVLHDIYLDHEGQS
jgi:hypothetical protein